MTARASAGQLRRVTMPYDVGNGSINDNYQNIIIKEYNNQMQFKSNQNILVTIQLFKNNY